MDDYEGERNAGDPTVGRWRWLGHPAFLACVLLLILNDHVLKREYPGWWTGKLSDLAGLLVVGTLLAVVLDVRRGVVIAGVAFALLKVVPGIAEIASPILGGVTRRDFSDLLAILALGPLYLLLGKQDPSRLHSGVSGEEGGLVTRCVRSLGNGLAVGLPIAGVVAALAGSTATSCSPGPAVTQVVTQGTTFYALVTQDLSEPKWARSDDGGVSWTRGDPADHRLADSISQSDAYEDPGPAGTLEACSSDGTCWRLVDQRAIVRESPDGKIVEEMRLTDEEYSDISTGCIGSKVGILGSIAVTEDGEPQVVASLGADGVVSRTADGNWAPHKVLSAGPPVRATPVDRTALWIVFTYGPVATLLLWIGRRWLPSWRLGLAVVGLGWFATLMVATAIGFLAAFGAEPGVVASRVGAVGLIVTTIVGVVVGARPRPDRPIPAPSNLQPLPLPPPPRPPAPPGSRGEIV